MCWSSAAHENRQDSQARQRVIQAVVARVQAMNDLQADAAHIRRDIQALRSSRLALTTLDERVARVENGITQLSSQVTQLTQLASSWPAGRVYASQREAVLAARVIFRTLPRNMGMCAGLESGA